ncbi:hypothetical protein JCGZ_03901 [Jatropha curcas]|uniref:Uncharacterized protein n=1 Tax=Jatropha curcas TaxID=180498 RepID=A0A067LI67_JATCU|nr:hypothetical protein JCGZ_03901 [Jatropha curcas]
MSVSGSRDAVDEEVESYAPPVPPVAPPATVPIVHAAPPTDVPTLKPQIERLRKYAAVELNDRKSDHLL